MNKIVTILVAAMMFLMPAAHAQTSFMISPNPVVGNQGDTVQLSMVVNNFTDMLSAQYGLKWDPTVLEYVSIDSFNLASLTEGSFNVNGAGDFLSLSWFDNSAVGVTVPDGTVIYTMTFVVLGDAATSGTAISFAERPGLIIEFASNNGEITNNTTISGSQFGDPANNNDGNDGNTAPLVSGISTASGQSGTTVCVDVSVGNFTDITAMEYSLVWDASILQFSEIRNINLAGLSQASFNSSTNGQLGVNWANNAGATVEDGTIYQVCFDLTGNAGTSSNIAFGNNPTPINVTTTASTTSVGITQTTGLIAVNNTNPPPVDPPPATDTALVNVQSVNTTAGSTVCVPLTVNNFNNLAGIQFSVNWNPAELQYTEVSNINLVDLVEGNFNTTTTDNGNLSVVWTEGSTNGISIPDGTAIFEICFTVLGANGTTAAISFTDNPVPQLAVMPDREDPFQGGNGVVTVGEGGPVNPPPVPTTPDDGLVNATSVSAASGSVVCVPITVNDFDNLAGLQFSLNWDVNALAFIEVRNLNLLDLAEGNFNTTAVANGSLSVVWTEGSTNGISVADGTAIFEVCFTVLGANGTNTRISVTDNPVPQLAVTSSSETPFQGTDGIVNITDGGPVDPPPPPVNPPDDGLVNATSATAESGSVVCVPITVNDFDNLAGLQFSLNWDVNALTFTEVRNLNLMDLALGNFNTTAVDNGSLSVVWTEGSTNGISVPDGTAIFEVCFTVLGANGTNTTLAVTDNPVPQLAVTSNSETSFQGTNGLITIQGTIDPPPPTGTALVNATSQTAPSGSVVCVPITVNDFDNLAGLQFSLNWDPAALAFTEVRNLNLQDLAEGNFNTNAVANGGLSVVWTEGTTNGISVPDETVIFEVCYTVLGANGTSTTIVFSDNPVPQLAVTSNSETPFQGGAGTITIEGGVPCAGPITAIATPTNVTCNGENDGAISLEVSGGNGTFTYQWSDPNIGNIPNPTGLAAGVYSVTITSCGGQEVKSDIPSASLTITEPPALVVVTTPQNATCFGVADGRINVSLSGGTLPYTYTWSDATLAPVNRPVNAAAGTYSLTVTDATGCEVVTDGITISSPSEIVAIVVTTNASCSGKPDGSATLTPSGGSGGDYTFDWGDDDIVGANPTNVPAADYMVTITDGNQCTSIIPVTVAADIVVSGAIQVIEDACGTSQGAIQITPSGGTGPYSYSWAAGPVDIGDTNRAENIPTGTYAVTVTDANGCFFVETIEVGGPTAILTASADIQNVDCPGDDAGSIALTATGGFSPYTYSWSNGATTATINNLEEGVYTVTVTDSKVCTYTETFTISATSNMVVTVEITKGAPDATATATVTGGVEPYSYEWCNGQTTATATGLDEGICSLTVIDALGCTVVQNIDIVVDNPVPTIMISSPVTCNGQADGVLTVTVEGGNSPYTYAWSNGGTTPTITNLSAGNYEVTVSDAEGKLGTADIDLMEPAAIVIDQTELMAVCEDELGRVCINISGGTAPYKEIRWSNGVMDALCIDDLRPGEYGVIVTDQNDCTQEANFRVTSDPACVPCYESNMVMTPNDDGRNDAFCINCVDIAPNNRLEIYNRWGQLVFEADNYQCVLGTESDCWRGNTRNGNGIVGEGGYFWILEFDGPDGRTRIKNHFTILEDN